jgi:hypothetical protein
MPGNICQGNYSQGSGLVTRSLHRGPARDPLLPGQADETRRTASLLIDWKETLNAAVEPGTQTVSDWRRDARSRII